MTEYVPHLTNGLCLPKPLFKFRKHPPRIYFFFAFLLYSNKFKKFLPNILLFPLREHDALTVMENVIIYVSIFSLGLFCPHRESVYSVRLICRTVTVKRTFRALWPRGEADTCTQVHHRLVKLSGCFTIKQCLCLFADAFFTHASINGVRKGKKTGEDSHDIAIHHGMRRSKGEGGNGSCRICPHSG